MQGKLSNTVYSHGMKYLWSLFALLTLGLPKASAATSTEPLPPLDQVLQHVKQVAAMDNVEYHAFNQHYFYTRDRVTEFFDSSGNVKERHEKQSTNSPSPLQVLLQSQPAASKTVAPGKQASAAEPPNVHGIALGKKEDLLNPDIIKRYKFTLAGREIINRRPALILDFKPVSDDLPVFNLKDRFLNSIAGRAWVDESDYVLVKADIHLTQKISVLGGVVGAVSKFNFSFIRERTADGFWFTRDMNWHVEAREATFPQVVTQRETVSGVQKMQ